MTPIEKIKKEALDIILYGGNEKFDVVSKDVGITRNYEIDFEGIINFISNQFHNTESTSIKRWAKEFMDENICSECNGSRLRKEALTL